MSSASKNIGTKRIRAANFTEVEIRILVETVLKHILDVIENKQSNKKAHSKFEMFYKTGDGPPNLKEFTDYEDKVFSHIVLSVASMD